MLTPQGQLAWQYDKTHPVPELDQEGPGDGQVPTIGTPDGRLSNVICFDGDWPALLRQAGQAHVDIMLIPSNDWQQIDPWHSQHATFRAIEEGFSEVRQTSQGLSLAVDYEGHVLAASDYYTTNDQVIVASVPTQGAQTIYALVGDLFAWLCVAGFLVLMTFALWSGKRRKATLTDSSHKINLIPSDLDEKLPIAGDAKP